MENHFFNFINPFLDKIDGGDFFRKPFKWLYTTLAALNLLFPFYLLYICISEKVFKYAEAKAIILLILILLVVAFASWVSFQLWWNRKDKVTLTSEKDDNFIAIPVFSHFIQTLGEWIGSWIAIVGCLSALLFSLFLGSDSSDSSSLAENMSLGFLNVSLLGVIIMPIYGFLIIVSSRVLAEGMRALAMIANNTRK